jgi:hypothetical protein
MATENLDVIDSAPAAADLSASQYCAAVYNSSGQYALAGTNAIADGLIHNAPASGEQCRVIVAPVARAKAKAGAAVSKNALLATDSTGRLLTATTGQNVVAKALTAAGAANEIFDVRWFGPTGRVAP